MRESPFITFWRGVDAQRRSLGLALATVDAVRDLFLDAQRTDHAFRQAVSPHHDPCGPLLPALPGWPDNSTVRLARAE
jgi:hypothetical protein